MALSKMRWARVSICAGTSVLALLASAPGLAQTADQAAAQSGDAPRLEDIVVTAQRRDEREQEVPIAINTVSAEAALRAGANSTETLSVAVPALVFNRQAGQGGTPFLRGVGASASPVTSESPVATYVDDVYLGGATGTLFSFNNISSVEVLKGPQGTLFGRNATGGVIHVRTKPPTQQTAFAATVGYGSYDTFNASAYLNGPITEELSANIAVTGMDQDGYGRSLQGRDIYKGKDVGVRAQALWEPSPNTSIRLAADYYTGKDDFGLALTIAPGTVAVGGATFPGRYRSNDEGDYAKRTLYGASLKLEQGIGDLTLVSISAYRKTKVSYDLDNDGTLPGGQLVNIFSPQEQDSYSQELQLRSPEDGSFQWILGGFYYRAESEYFLRVSGLAFAALGGAALTNTDVTLNSYSGFADANYALTPRTKITAGIRYTKDDLALDALLRTGTGAIRPPGPVSRDASFSKVTYRAVLDHKLGDDVLLYGSYSRGFRAGAFNVASPVSNNQASPAVRPEVVDAFEAGFKSEFFNNRLRVNASAFHYNYKDQQLPILTGFGTTTTVNAAKSRKKGIDLDITYALTNRLTVRWGSSILSSKFTSFPEGQINVPNPASCAPVRRTTGPLTGGNTLCPVDLKGAFTPHSPKFNFSASATYVLPTEVGDFTLDASLYHNSGFFWEVGNRFRQPRHDLLNASIGWTSSNERYSVRVFGRNLLDEYYFTYFSEGPIRDSGSPDRPRNYGVSLGYSF